VRRRFASLRAIAALVLREMSTSYGKSPGGFIWAVLEPVAAIALLTVAFSVMFKQPSIGISFPLFYASGMLPFGLYSLLAGRLAAAFQFSRNLLAYPAVTFVDALAARAIVGILTQGLVAFIVFCGILYLTETRAVVNLPLLALSFALAALVGCSVGILNAFLMTMFPLWQVGWSVFSRPLFLASGILFLYRDLPHQLQDILWYNPLMHVVGIARAGFYPTYNWDYVSVTYVVCLSLVLTLVGLRLLAWYHRDLLQG
jgi:capsular polysaccharide transport system permease protein